MKKWNLLVAPSKTGPRGYLLVEIAVVMAVLSGLLVITTEGMAAHRNYLAKNQLKVAVNMLARDIIYVQQKSLFDGDNSNYFLEMDQDGYCVRDKQGPLKKVRFSSLGCTKIYLRASSPRLSFSNNGRPKNGPTLEIRHRELKRPYYEISVEPVTGRVAIHEKS